MGSFEDKFERFLRRLWDNRIWQRRKKFCAITNNLYRVWVGRDPAVLLAESYTQDDQWFNGVLPEEGHWVSYLKTLRAAGDISRLILRLSMLLPIE